MPSKRVSSEQTQQSDFFYYISQNTAFGFDRCCNFQLGVFKPESFPSRLVVFPPKPCLVF